MSEFERELPPFRLAQTHHGDDLQAVADRETGDANRWTELVWLNTLTHPYITDNPGLVSETVLLSGAFIRIPAPIGLTVAGASTGQVFERDCVMTGRLLSTEDGDLSVVTGAKNLRQQLQHRIDTPRGQARRHPDYGSLHHRLLGTVNGPVAGMLAAEYVKSALGADYRVASVPYSRAEVLGDRLVITAQAKAIDGGVVDVVTG